MPTGRPTLESVVLAERLVDDAALRAARRTALRRRVALVEVLVDEHTVEEDKLVDALARTLGRPRLALGQPIDEEALRELPHDLAAAYLCVPVHLDSTGEQRTLRLAIANPLDADALEDIGHATGCQIEPVVAGVSELRRMIERSYQGLITRMIPRTATDELRPSGEPSTRPVELPDERSLELRVRALIELLHERGLIAPAELDERVRRLVRGEDV